MFRRGRRIAWLLIAALLTPHAVMGQASRRPYAAARYGGNYMHNYLIPPAPSATPWLPEWSPDGREIAFSMMGSVWIVELASGVAREVISGPRYYSSPAWSPDGAWLVVTADDGGRSVQLEMLHLATGRRVALTTDAQVYLDPRWSPDGSRLAYTASRPQGYFNVFVRPVRDGAWAGDEVQVTRDSNLGRDRPYFTAQDMHITPAWLPSGRELLLVSNRGVSLGSGAVVQVPADSAGDTRARPLVQEQTLYAARPHASRDGHVVWASARGGTDPTLALFHLAPGADAPVQLARFDWDAMQPRWSPDRRHIAFVSNREGTTHLALLEVATGAVRDVRITERRHQRPMATLRLRVRDDAGRHIPARVHLTAADGKLYTPDTAFARLSWAGDRVFHATDVAELRLPPGHAILTVTRGFEFTPHHDTLSLAADQVQEVTVRLPRVANLATRGWFSGSTGVHMHEGGPLRYSMDALFAHAAAEGQDFMGNPIAHNDRRIPDSAFWRPGGPASRRHGVTMTIGQEHRPGFHGHVALFGTSTRLPSLFPVTVGYEDNPGTSLLPSNTEVLRRARQPGTVAAYVHAFSGEDDPMRAGLGLGKAFMIDAALGTVDALEWATANRASFVPWYALLNNGIRVAALGGEDTIANLYIMRLVGAVRTYVACPAGFTPEAWWEGARRGRSFVTTGPLVNLEVNGVPVGGEVRLARPGRVRLTAWVRSITPLQRVFVVANGEEVATLPLDATRTRVDTTLTLPVTRSGWVHLRAEGSSGERFPLDALYAQAFTNPTWVTVAGQAPRDSTAAAYALKWIDMYQLMADAWPGWSDDGEKRQLWAQLDAARTRFRQLMQEAHPAPRSAPPTGVSSARTGRYRPAPPIPASSLDH